MNDMNNSSHSCAHDTTTWRCWTADKEQASHAFSKLNCSSCRNDGLACRQRERQPSGACDKTKEARLILGHTAIDPRRHCYSRLVLHPLHAVPLRKQPYGAGPFRAPAMQRWSADVEQLSMHGPTAFAPRRSLLAAGHADGGARTLKPNSPIRHFQRLPADCHRRRRVHLGRNAPHPPRLAAPHTRRKDSAP